MSEAISIENQKDRATEVFEKEGLPTEALLKEGYKKTKLGWIPEDWSIKSLDEMGVFSKGKGISKSEITETGLACVRYAEIYTKYNNNTYSFNSFINRNSAKNSRTIESGDILFAGSGETLEDIGKCIAYLGKETVYAGGDIVVLKPKSENSKYLSFVLNHTIANKQKHKLGQGHSVVHIYSSSLKKLKIPLPPLPEQEKIAAILSTWDNVIGKQEQLIAAKQHYKKGLMQLLLTGKKRFPGFDEEWDVVKLDTVCVFKNGKAHEKIISSDGKYTVVNSKFISTNGKVKKFTHQQVSPLHENNIVMVMSDVPNGRALSKCYLIEETDKYSLNQRICSLKAKNIEPSFLFYQLNRNKYYLKFNDGIGQTNLKKKEVLNCPISKPSKIEQRKIISILTSTKKEIDLLQNQLTHLQTQKRGLMQKLLTGEVLVKI